MLHSMGYFSQLLVQDLLKDTGLSPFQEDYLSGDPTPVCLALPEIGGEGPVMTRSSAVFPVPQAPPVCTKMLLKLLPASVPTSSLAWERFHSSVHP